MEQGHELPEKVCLEESVPMLRDTLLNTELPMAKRFRTIFTLRNIGGKASIDALTDDKSALLKHEIAYCLGQMRDQYAIPTLNKVLMNEQENAMVRHEAAEALGAIANPDSIPLLEKYLNDPVVEVAETCSIAIDRIKWFMKNQNQALPESPFLSVDPAPPHPSKDVSELRNILLDKSLSLFERYRAMFGLRDLNTTEAVKALAEGLTDSSALFRHEIAYVLGQLQNPAAGAALSKALEDQKENPMVRHEAAEALGAISSDEFLPVLEKYTEDSQDVVKESCLVATDIHDYFQSDQFQYADGISQTVKF